MCIRDSTKTSSAAPAARSFSLSRDKCCKSSEAKMFSRTSLALVAGLALFSADLVHRAAGHPGCDGDVNLADNLEPIFCPTDLDVIYEEGFCCDPVMEANIILQLDASTATGRCAEMQQEVRSTARQSATIVFFTTSLIPRLQQ